MRRSQINFHIKTISDIPNEIINMYINNRVKMTKN